MEVELIFYYFARVMFYIFTALFIATVYLLAQGHREAYTLLFMVSVSVVVFGVLLNRSRLKRIERINQKIKRINQNSMDELRKKMDECKKRYLESK